MWYRHSNNSSGIVENSYPILVGSDSTIGYDMDIVRCSRTIMGGRASPNFEPVPAYVNRIPARFSPLLPFSSAGPIELSGITLQKYQVPADIYPSPEKKCLSPAVEYGIPEQKYRSHDSFNVIPERKYRSDDSFNVIPEQKYWSDDSFNVIPERKYRSDDSFNVIPEQKYRSHDGFSVIPDGKNVIPVTDDSFSEVFRSIRNEHTLSIILSTKIKRRIDSDGHNG